MERLFQEVVLVGRWRATQRGQIWRPPTDVYETDDYVIVKVEIAGMEESDFTISLSDQVLTIRGVRRDPAAKLAYQQMEIAYGEFQTQVYLPWAVSEEQEVEATYSNGFLKVVLPKAKARKVPVVSEEVTNKGNDSGG